MYISDMCACSSGILTAWQTFLVLYELILNIDIAFIDLVSGI